MKQEERTFLSPRVHHLLTEAINHREGSDTADRSDAFCSNKTFNFHNIARTLPDPTDTYEYFVHATISFGPIIEEMTSYYESLDKGHFMKKLAPMIQWTTHPEVLEYCYDLISSTNEDDVLLSLLLSSAILERSLGKVYLLEGEQCPSMLKDLLVTTELCSILGKHVIQVLRVVIGPPVSLNLRNVVWHGFPKPGELSYKLGYLMLHLCVSLGHCLYQAGIRDLPTRPWITFPKTAFIQHVFREFSNEDIAGLKEVFYSSTVINKHMLSVWMTATDRYQNGRYGESVVLLLPQLEHALRCIFAKVNECEERILTAENTVLYTTFDEMLQYHMPDESINKLPSSLGDSVMNMLLDLLVHPEGPRLRDHVSHGEVDITQVSQSIATFLLGICASVCIEISPCPSTHDEKGFYQKIKVATDTYYSIFHPLPSLQREISECCKSLSQWSEISLPDTQEWKESVETANSKEYRNFKELFSTVYQTVSQKHPKYILLGHTIDSLSLPYGEMKDLQMIVEQLRFSVLYRNEQRQMDSTVFSEAEYIGLLRRIIVECMMVSDQIQAVMNERYIEWKQKRLRSRQRNTYRRMLYVLPELSCGLRLVTLTMMCLLFGVDPQPNYSPEYNTRLFKLLKLTLQYCENMRTYTSAQRNRWEEAKDLTDKLVEKTMMFCDVTT